MRTRAWVVVCFLGALAVVWLAIVLCYWHRHEQDKLGPVGDSFAPIGALLTIIALVTVFEQRHEDANRAHDDAQRAHRDRLADSYSQWFERAWGAINRAVDEIGATVNSDAVASITNDIEYRLPEFEREIRIAAVPVLMIDRNADRVASLRKTQDAFPRWPHSPLTDYAQDPRLGEYRAYAQDLVARLKVRRTAIELLLDNVSTELALENVIKTSRTMPAR